MNIQEVVENAFIEEWIRLGGSRSQLDLPTLRQKFNLNAVQNSVNLDIRSALYEEQRERYHIMNLRKLAQIYAQILFRESIRGTELHETRMFSARNAMKAQGPCDDVYPC